jgi:hypothetical protein
MVAGETEFERLSHPAYSSWYRTPHDHAKVSELQLVMFDPYDNRPPEWMDEASGSNRDVLVSNTAAPPEEMRVDTSQAIALSSYRIEPLDILQFRVEPALKNAPLTGTYYVEPDEKINLGLPYGSVQVGGLTLEQAQQVVQDHLSKIIETPQVSIGLWRSHGLQQIVDERPQVLQPIKNDPPTRPDGKVGLGRYGMTSIAAFSTSWKALTQ